MALPLAGVSAIAVRRGDTLKTLGLVVAGVIVLPFAAIGAACALGADCHFGY